VQKKAASPVVATKLPGIKNSEARSGAEDDGVNIPVKTYLDTVETISPKMNIATPLCWALGNLLNTHID
jgi:hypothetical protein